MNNKEKILKNIENGTFFPFAKNAIRRRIPVWVVTNRSLINDLMYYRAYKILKRKYRDDLNHFQANTIENKTIPPIIWTFWGQGLDNAPDLVKVCYQSVRKYMTDYKINFISAENMQQFVDIPEYILEKWKRGQISYAHFSDYLRVALLTEYGGVWVDAAVLFTGRVDFNEISAGGLFVFKDRQGEKRGSLISNWLIAANRESNILRCVRCILEEYWKDNNYVIDYFLFHIFFALAAERFSDEWMLIPTYTNDVPHILSSEMAKPYTEKRFDQIRRMSNIHKLSWHKEASSMPAGSFYDVLIRKKIEKQLF